MKKRIPISNIAAEPIGAVLFLPSPPTADAVPQIGILLNVDGSTVPMQAMPKADGKWDITEPSQITPTDIRAALKTMATIRKEAEREVARLIDILDRLDCNMEDREEQGDDDNGEIAECEPLLGSLDRAVNQQRWADGRNASYQDESPEAEHDGREPDADGEPSLGAVEDDWLFLGGKNCPGDQTQWARGSDSDREVETPCRMLLSPLTGGHRHG